MTGHSVEPSGEPPTVMPLDTDDNDWLFEAMAQAIDRAGAAQTELLLAKFAMLLANLQSERAPVELALKQAIANLHSIDPNNSNR